MDGSSRAKCSECVRVGKPCVNLSWSSLDKTREDYQKKVDDDEDLLAEVMARLMRNKKILRQATKRAKKKAQCLMSTIDAARELEDPDPQEDYPAADATVGLSPAVQSTLGQLDDFIDFGSSSAGAAPAEGSQQVDQVLVWFFVTTGETW